jgi:hypothetical protein
MEGRILMSDKTTQQLRQLLREIFEKHRDKDEAELIEIIEREIRNLIADDQIQNDQASSEDESE